MIYLSINHPFVAALKQKELEEVDRKAEELRKRREFEQDQVCARYIYVDFKETCFSLGGSGRDWTLCGSLQSSGLHPILRSTPCHMLTNNALSNTI